MQLAGADCSLEGQIAARKLRLQPVGSDSDWRLNSQPGCSDCKPEAQIAARKFGLWQPVASESCPLIILMI